jgi:hypothetical protein
MQNTLKAYPYINKLLILPFYTLVILSFSKAPKESAVGGHTIPYNKCVAEQTTPSLVCFMSLPSQDTSHPVAIKVDKEPGFPGGVQAWRSFLAKNLNPSLPADNGAPSGMFTVIVQFLVDEAGDISELQTISKNGYGMEEEVLRIMQKSPKWIPAQLNGKNVTYRRKQPITFVVAN